MEMGIEMSSCANLATPSLLGLDKSCSHKSKPEVLTSRKLEE